MPPPEFCILWGSSEPAPARIPDVTGHIRADCSTKVLVPGHGENNTVVRRAAGPRYRALGKHGLEQEGHILKLVLRA